MDTLNTIWQWIINFWSGLYNVGKWLLDGVVTVLMVIVKLLFDGLLTVVYGIVAGLDFGTLLTQTAASWGLLNDNVAWFVVQLGVSTGLSILGYAFVIRLTLNLIPGVLTRI